MPNEVTPLSELPTCDECHQPLRPGRHWDDEQPARQNGPRPRFTQDQMEVALRAAGGNFTQAARYLEEHTGRPCSRQLVRRYVNVYPRLAEANEELHHELLDIAEGTMVRGIREGDRHWTTFWLKHKGGYNASHQVDVNVQAKIELEAHYSVDSQLQRFLTRAGEMMENVGDAERELIEFGVGDENAPAELAEWTTE